MKSLLKFTAISVLSLICISEVPGVEPASGDSESNGLKVICQLSYQPPAAEAKAKDSKVKIDLPAAGQKFKLGETVEFDDMAFATRYARDYLAIDVVNLTTKKRICHHVYQFGKDPKNQFEGDHGFTGLVHVFHPNSGAELQFSCRFIGK